MSITVKRFQRQLDGTWTEITPPLVLDAIPEAAYQIAASRGAVEPGKYDIEIACKQQYGRTLLHGYANLGDIDVQVIHPTARRV